MSSSQSRLRIAVLFGGRSSEHDVSIMSATNVMRALDPERYDALPVYVSKDGRWLQSWRPFFPSPDAKAPEGWRSPRPGGLLGGLEHREASWTEVVLYRFSLERGGAGARLRPSSTSRAWSKRQRAGAVQDLADFPLAPNIAKRLGLR